VRRSTLAASALAASAAVVLLLVSLSAATAPYVRGDFNNWELTDPMMWIMTDGGREIWERTRSLSAGTYGYKIYVDDWGDKWWGGPSGYETGVPQSLDLSTPGNNIGLVINITDYYVFQFWFLTSDPWTKHVVVKRAAFQVPGTFNSWDVDDNNMTPLGPDPWNDNWESSTYDVTGPTTVEFKIIMGNTWESYHWGWESAGDPQPMPHSGTAIRRSMWNAPNNIKVSFPANTTEQFKIRVRHREGYVDYWVIDLTAPASTTLTSPDNEALFYVSPVTLSWENVDDHSRPVKYQVYLTTDPTFATVEHTSDWITGTSWQTPTLATGRWYWRVGTMDAAGNFGENSDVRCFDIAPWWNENWPYRRKITISGTHEENFQIRIDIPPEIPKGMYPSIRFLENADNGILPYWIERNGSTYTNVAWVRRLENADDEIWMYYGNPWATSAENGEDVFLFFDDFGPGESPKWSKTVNPGNIRWWKYQVFFDAQARMENKPGLWLSQIPHTIEFKMWNRESYRGGLTLTGVGVSEAEIACIFDGPRFWVMGEQKTGIPSRWYIARVDLWGTNSVKTTFYWGSDNGSYREFVWQSGTKTWEWYYSGPGDSYYMDKYNLRVWDQDKDYFFDWIFVRKYAATEPTTSVGAEETWLTDWFLPQYGYRRKITVSGSFPDNFQIRVNIPTDIPKAMYPSIRFLRTKTGGPLPFWIERNESGYLSVAWVKVPSGTTEIWMYYGCTGAVSAESGEDTFIFFTDFAGGDGGREEIDWTKWGAPSAGVDLFAYVLRLEDYGDARRDMDYGKEQGFPSATEGSTERIIEFRIKNASTWRGGVRTVGPSWDMETAMIFKDDGNFKFFAAGTWGTKLVQGDRYYIGQIILYGSNRMNVNFYFGADNINYRQLMENVRDWAPGDWRTEVTKYKLSVWNGGGTSTYYYDWFLVRRYNPYGPDPTVTLGDPESRIPTKPVLSAPANGSITSDNTPSFNWQDSENEDNYRLLVDDDSNFGSPEVDVLLPANTTSYTLTSELPDETYYWKVVAINEAGENESDVWSFVLDTIPPTIDNDIWWAGVYFDSRNSNYFSPLGTPITSYPENVTGEMLPLETVVTVKIRTYEHDVESVKLRIWMGFENIVDMVKESSDGTYDYWSATIYGPSSEDKWWFRFILQDGTDTDYYEDDWPRVGGWGAMYDESPDRSWLIWFRTAPTAGVDGDVWWDGVFFDSRNTFYKSPAGTPLDNFGEQHEANEQITLRLRTWANDVDNVQVRVWEEVAAQEVIYNMEKKITENGFDWWEVTLPAPMQADNWWYRFIVKDTDDVDYYQDHEERDAGIGRMYDEATTYDWKLEFKPLLNVPPEVLACTTPGSVDPNSAFDVKVTVRDYNKLSDIKEVWVVLYSSSVSREDPDAVRDHYTFKWVRGEGFSEVGPGTNNEHLVIAGCSAGDDDQISDDWTFRVRLGKVAEPVSWNVWAKAVETLDNEDSETFTGKFTVNVYLELSLDDTALTFSGLQGETLAASENPTVATVTANVDFDIQVKGAGDWSGPGTLLLSNTKADKDGSSPYDLELSTSWQSLWTGVGWGEDVQKNIYWFLAVPIDTTPGNYTNTMYVRVSS